MVRSAPEGGSTATGKEIRPRYGDSAELREALEMGHMQVLIAVLLHLSDDQKWWDERYRPRRTRGLEDNRDGGLPEEVQAEIRDAVFRLVVVDPVGVSDRRRELTDAELTRIATFALGEDVPEGYGAFMQEILAATVSRGPARRMKSPRHGASQKRAIIIGAGPSGIISSIRLQELGIEHVIIEKEPEAGGAWQNNSYPGCGVDTPSYLYSYSFHGWDWSTHFGKRDEVHSYFIDVAKVNGIHERARFRTEVLRMQWAEDSASWSVVVRNPDGSEEVLVADFVLVGTGALSRPKMPDIPGLDSFQGVVTHSAEWPDGLDVAGKRVALVGAGASAMQIGPAIVGTVSELLLFQRSKQWVAPCDIYFTSFDDAEHFLMSHVPAYLQWYRARLNWIYNDRIHDSLQVDPQWDDPEHSINAANAAHRRYFERYIREKLAGRADLIEHSIPEYPPYGKRMLLDNGWYDMLLAPQTSLVSEGVVRVTPRGLVDSRGVEREVDVIVFATGFHADRFLYPMTIVGRDGRDTVQTWGPHDARAYLGLTAPNFPNMFFLGGPNTLLGHGGSFIGIAEMQAEYIARIITEMIHEDVKAIAVRSEICDRYVQAVDDAHSRMVWTHKGMTNWYRNADGRVLAVTPWKIVDYRRMLKHSGLADFDLTA